MELHFLYGSAYIEKKNVILKKKALLGLGPEMLKGHIISPVQPIDLKPKGPNPREAQTPFQWELNLILSYALI